MALPSVREQVLNFDIDRYMNPIIPRSRLYMLPKPASRWFGYRETQPSKLNNLVTWAWTFIGCFLGIALITGVFKASHVLQGHHPPVIIGSFGAMAILSYGTIESPLAQPRSAFVGQMLGALAGVSISKLFGLLSASQFKSVEWAAGALAVACASGLMNITNTMHPPAGATALLAATSPSLTRLGWYYLALVALGSVLMLGSALIINNIQRRYPLYWWTPVDLSKEVRKPKDSNSEDEEKNLESEVEGKNDSVPYKRSIEWNDSSSEDFSDAGAPGPEAAVVVVPGKIIVPLWLQLDEETRELLEKLRLQLGEINSSDRTT